MTADELNPLPRRSEAAVRAEAGYHDDRGDDPWPEWAEAAAAIQAKADAGHYDSEPTDPPF